MPYDTAISCAKTAAPTEMPFGLWIWVGRRKHVLYRGILVHLVITTELSMCGSDVALCQITLTTCSQL